MKPKAGRIGYRDWIAVTIGDGKLDATSLREPAAAVIRARSERGKLLREEGDKPDPRIRIGGWAMNNMEAIAYVVAEEPMHVAADAELTREVDMLARSMADAGDQVAGALRSALRQALFDKTAKPSFDASLFREARDAFFETSDAGFHSVLDNALTEAVPTGSLNRERLAREWLKMLRRAAFQAFDAAASAPLDDAERAIKIVKARAKLVLTLSGWSKEGGALFDTLGLPRPEKAPETGVMQRKAELEAST